MLFITHALPKNLQVDEIVQVGMVRLSTANTAILDVASTPA